MDVVHGHIETVAGGIGVFFEGEAMVLVQDRFAEFAAVRLGDLDFPGIHRGKGLGAGTEKLKRAMVTALFFVSVSMYAAVAFRSLRQNFLGEIGGDLLIVAEFLAVAAA